MADVDAFIHRFEPAADAVPSATLLLLHGTGGDENDLVPLGRMLAPGFALLSPRGQVLERGMPRFFRRIAEGVFDVDDLVARTHHLADWIGAAAAHYRRDPARIVALGFSNGANIAASLLLLRPDVLAGAALLSPMVPFEPERPPALGGRVVLIASGRDDPIAPPEGARDLARILERGGAEVDFHAADGGHGVAPSTLRTTQGWIAKHFGR